MQVDMNNTVIYPPQIKGTKQKIISLSDYNIKH